MQSGNGNSQQKQLGYGERYKYPSMEFRRKQIQHKKRYESIWWTGLKMVCGKGYDQNWFENNIKWSLRKGEEVRF